MPIAGQGWELHIERFRVDPGGDRKRTVGRYQVYRNGQPVDSLSGQICECAGPGNNEQPRSGKRIRPGRYPLYTHGTADTKYRTVHYAESTAPAEEPMAGFLLYPTGSRGPILVHPAHPPHLYLSSTGCLNPTRPVGPRENMNYSDSRQRVIDMIEELKRLVGGSLPEESRHRIEDAWAVIDGEPM